MKPCTFMRMLFVLAAACGTVAAAPPEGSKAPPPVPSPGQVQPPDTPAPPEGDGRRPWREGGDGSRGPGQGEGRGPGMIPNVGRSMNGMNRALSKLAEHVGDASKKDENLTLICEAQRACVSAKLAPVPPGVLEHAKDDAGKAKIKAEFRAHLIQSLKYMIEIEESIDAGRLDAAKGQVEKLVQYRDTSHAEFGVEEEEEHADEQAPGKES